MTADTTPLPHDEAVELLEPFVDGRLGPALAAQVQDHVAGCDECAAILSDVEPVDLATPSAVLPAVLDERTMRRSVRRTLLGVAAQAAGIVVLLLVVAVVASLLVVQPLLLGGDRTAALARATYEVPSLVTPGAAVREFGITSSGQSRTFTTELELPVGSSTVSLGSVSSTRRLVGSDTPLWPYVDDDAPNPAPASEVLDRLGRTSVATVAVQLPSALSVDDAQALVEDLHPDVSTVWAGFDVAGLTDRIAPTDALSLLGATTCGAPRLPSELFGATSADAGASFGAAPSSVEDALRLVRDAVAHVGAHPELATVLPDGLHEALVAADEGLGSGEPAVTLLVLTGPSDRLGRALDATGARDARVLATATYNWDGPVCG